MTSLLQLGGPGTQRLTAWPGAGGKKANARLRRVSAACSGAAALDAPYGDWTLMEASTGTELSSWRIFGMATNKHTGYNHQPRAADVWLLRALPRASVRAVWIKEGACALGPEWQEVDGRATSKIPDGFTSYKQARAGWVGGWVGTGGGWRGRGARARGCADAEPRGGTEGGTEWSERASERASEASTPTHRTSRPATCHRRSSRSTRRGSWPCTPWRRRPPCCLPRQFTRRWTTSRGGKKASDWESVLGALPPVPTGTEAGTPAGVAAAQARRDAIAALESLLLQRPDVPGAAARPSPTSMQHALAGLQEQVTAYMGLRHSPRQTASVAGQIYGIGDELSDSVSEEQVCAAGDDGDDGDEHEGLDAWEDRRSQVASYVDCRWGAQHTHM